MNFLRHLLGARACTSHMIMLRELGEYPLQLQIAYQAVSFWNKVMEMPAGTLARSALLQSKHLAESTPDCWFGQLHKYLASIGCGGMISVDGSPCIFFDKEKIVYAHRALCHNAFLPTRTPHADDSAGIKLALYHRVFAQALPTSPRVKWAMHPYLCTSQPYDAITKLSRFRLGCHFLQIEVGRWNKEGYVVTEERYCCRKGCDKQGSAVDHEWHAIFECTAFEAIRSEFSQLFADNRKDLRSLFSCPVRCRDLVRFIKKINVC
jgi:hypothetical protein